MAYGIQNINWENRLQNMEHKLQNMEYKMWNIECGIRKKESNIYNSNAEAKYEV